MWEEYELTPNNVEEYKEVTSPHEVQKQVNSLRSEIRDLGSINVDSIQEYKEVKERYDFLSEQRYDLEESSNKLRKVIQEMTDTMKTQFEEQFKIINKNFGEVFAELFGGGKAELKLVDEDNILESGIDIEVQPPGKKLQNMMLLSGGERAFTAIAILFAILKINPAPFCVLDEIEAALDDVNVFRFADYIKRFTNETQFLVDRLKNYNNPVYIHSGDGDSVSLKVPDDTDTATGTKGILDRMDEHLEEKGTGAKIVIGGYNLYNLDEQKLIIEIVKADSGITNYADGSEIDKEKPSVDLKRYSENDKALIKAKVEQITHNTQVGNRYDRIIRDAISTVYPRMLYPTEPNMLVKAYDPSDHTDFFKTSFFDEEHRLKQQGSLWGMGASEGRVFKENLEREYKQEPESSGIGFVDWAKGASLPTDPRGFDRHLLISGYERYPEKKEDLSPAQGHAADKLGQEVPLVEAAVQQAQSYTSAYRLAELFAQSKNVKGKDKIKLRNDVFPTFKIVEDMVAGMMLGKYDLVSLTKMATEPVPSVSLSQSEQVTPATIVNAIRKELLAKYKFYNGIP